MRITRVIALAVISVASVLLYPTVASAAPKEATIKVGRFVDVNSAGTAASWTVRITCPRGSEFTLHALAADLGTDAPYDDGGDVGVQAVAEVTGTCKGGSRKLRLELIVQPGQLPDPVTGKPQSLFWPMAEDGGVANTFVTLSGESFSAMHCAHEACAEFTQDWRVQLT